MKLYYPITVDLYNLYPLKKMDAQQYNIGRGALVTLTAAGQVIAPDNETVTLWAKKPDNTVSYLPCTVANGQIKADFTNQMLALAGSVQVELRMIAGKDNITTTIFTVEVHPSNIDDDAVESQNEFTALQTAVSEINTALEEVDELKKTGLKGDPGEPGKDGEPGAAATIEIGTVEAGQPGSNPQITNAGTSNAAVFNFVLPRGETGPAGADGKEQVFFGAFADFPAVGNSEMLYVDTSNTAVLIMYRWNGTAYVPSGGGAADLDVVAKEFDVTKAYTKGEYVIYAGELYCFTSDKAAGEWDTSVVTPTTVGVELGALNAKSESSLAISIGGTARVNIVERCGKVVHLNFCLSSSVTGADVIAKIPEGYRPAKNIYPVGMGVVDSRNVAAVFEINTNGNISQQYTGGIFSNPCVDVTYLIDYNL